MRTSIFLAIVASSLLFAVISPTQGQDCVSPSETGPCKMDETRYYYDVKTKTCTEFIYGGCPGNGNNYKSLAECQATCQKQGHECVSPAETGPCKMRITRYYYDVKTKMCTVFIYGGCNGNGNNYESLAECQATCQKQGHDCVSPAETGPCKIDITRYYYDAETKTCTKFIYGGCRGNGNNYESLEECQATCQKQG